MNLSKIKIDPAFVDMVIRTMHGQQSIHDTMTGNADAAMANAMRLEKLRDTNEHFVAQICKSHLFQAGLQVFMTQVSGQNDNDTKRAMFAVFVAQAILIGMHMHEQLLDKHEQKGLRMS